MTTIQVKVQPCLARQQAIYQIGRARAGDVAMVSDPCVVSALLAVAAERGIKVEFYTRDDNFHKVALDLDGVSRLLAGEKP